MQAVFGWGRKGDRRERSGWKERMKTRVRVKQGGMRDGRREGMEGWRKILFINVSPEHRFQGTNVSIKGNLMSVISLTYFFHFFNFRGKIR